MKKQMIHVDRQIQIFTRGFTLIELMIVVSVIGVLAAFAVPTFQDYIIRTRVSEGLGLASAAKELVTENATHRINPLDTGWGGIIATQNTVSIGVEGVTGDITIRASAKADNIELKLTPSGNGGALVAGVIPTGRIEWVCTEATGTVSKNRLPTECR